MIVIPYPSGAFGSTLEYVLRHYSNELRPVDARVNPSGNMHSFTKECHPLSLAGFIEAAAGHDVVTPPYPNFDAKTPLQTLAEIKHNMPPAQVVLVYCATVEQAELCQLFTYHKTDNFLAANLTSVAHRWNPKYTGWKEMHRWERREALSFLIDRQADFIGAEDMAEKNWLAITPNDLLAEFVGTIDIIYKHCGLTFRTNAWQELELFYTEWRERQQYVLDEYELTQKIIQGKIHAWTGLSLLGEAIVQSGLRRQGQEMACDGLDVFPNNQQDLTALVSNSKISL
jgi:hypothetical protein